MYIILLLLLNCLWPAFELPSKVNSLFPHSYSENPEISFTTYQPFGQSYLHTSQLQYSTHIKDYVWHSDVIFTGDSLYAELSSTHWAGIKWTPNAIVSFGISYHELDITNFNKMSTFSTSFHLLLKVNKFSNMAVKGSHLYQYFKCHNPFQFNIYGKMPNMPILIMKSKKKWASPARTISFLPIHY